MEKEVPVHNIPDKVFIGGHECGLRFVHVVDDDDSCGEADCTTNIIKIKIGMPDSRMRETTIHEILHLAEPSLEETQIVFLSRTLLQLCKDNPFLKDLLFPPAS